MCATMSEPVAHPRRLAFVYHPVSFAVMAVAGAAEGVCELIWVVDGAMAQAAEMLPLLARLGQVVDVGGMSVEQAATSIRAADPEGILTFRDSLLVWTAEVAALLGLPFHTPQTAERLADKHLQRAALEAAGLRVPAHWTIPDGGDPQAWAQLAEQARFPALLKPRHGEGSRDVELVESLLEVETHAAALAARRGLEHPQLLLEEYLPDRTPDVNAEFAGYVSVETIVSRGVVSHLAITGRLPVAEPFRETGFFIPAALSESDRGAVIQQASAAIAAVGVQTGALHTEIKLTPEGPRVIEVNGRVGGGIPEMLASVAGLNMLSIGMRLALGEQIVFDAMPRCDGVGFRLLWQPPTSMHRVLSIDGLDELRAQPGVERVTINRHPGQDVNWHDGNWEHVFSVHGVVADHRRLEDLVQLMHTLPQVAGD